MFETRVMGSEVGLWCIALLALAIAYTLQFQMVSDEPVLRSARKALFNIAPIPLLGVSVRVLVRRLILHRPVIQQVALHVPLSIMFSHGWYLLVLLVAGFRLDWFSSGITISPFYSGATLWQLLQGVLLYAALQGLIYGRWMSEKIEALQIELAEARRQAPATAPAPASAVFVKAGAEFKKIDLADLIHLEADGDHVRLHTRFGAFTCTKSLTRYAQQLEDSGYIRVHRSHLVRADEIVSAEPTGDGRLSIHLSNGRSLIASRTGTRAFREYHN